MSLTGYQKKKLFVLKNRLKEATLSQPFSGLVTSYKMAFLKKLSRLPWPLDPTGKRIVAREPLPERALLRACLPVLQGRRAQALRFFL
jgi:hypothetical protein